MMMSHLSVFLLYVFIGTDIQCGKNTVHLNTGKNDLQCAEDWFTKCDSVF